MAKVVNIEEDHAQRALHPLHAVGLSKEHGEDGFAVVDTGQAVHLRIHRGGIAKRVEFARSAAGAQHQVKPELPIGGLRTARNQVVDHSFGQAVDPLLGNSVRNQHNRKTVTADGGARGRQQLVHLHAGQVCVEQRQIGWIGRGDRGERGLGRENDFDAGARSKEHRFNGSQQSGLGRCEQEDWIGVGEHPVKTSLLDASATVRNNLGNRKKFLAGFNDLQAGIRVPKVLRPVAAGGCSLLLPILHAGKSGKDGYAAIRQQKRWSYSTKSTWGAMGMMPRSNPKSRSLRMAWRPSAP